jgi:SAM-dependent methyltransferase
LQDKDILQLNFEKRMDFMEKAIVGKLPLSNCLEIGCAYGFFGEVLKRHRDTKYTGIDVVPEAVAYGRDILKLDLAKGDYLENPAEIHIPVFMGCNRTFADRQNS